MKLKVPNVIGRTKAGGQIRRSGSGNVYRVSPVGGSWKKNDAYLVLSRKDRALANAKMQFNSRDRFFGAPPRRISMESVRVTKKERAGLRDVSSSASGWPRMGQNVTTVSNSRDRLVSDIMNRPGKSIYSAARRKK